MVRLKGIGEPPNPFQNVTLKRAEIGRCMRNIGRSSPACSWRYACSAHNHAPVYDKVYHSPIALAAQSGKCWLAFLATWRELFRDN
jgi:hypothetical protein